MRRGSGDDDGFGLVEVVIAMLLLAIIAIAIAPALWNGIKYSTNQATVATSTRQLNSLVDQARDSGTCAGVLAAAAPHTFTDGAGRSFTTVAEDSSGAAVTPTCTAGGAAAKFTLVARQGGQKLGQVAALVYVP